MAHGRSSSANCFAALNGSFAAMIGRPTTRKLAPAATALAAVAVRAWSSAPSAALVGLMPGVTTVKSGPHAARIAPTSKGEATTPSMPAR